MGKPHSDTAEDTSKRKRDSHHTIPSLLQIEHSGDHFSLDNLLQLNHVAATYNRTMPPHDNRTSMDSNNIKKPFFLFFLGRPPCILFLRLASPLLHLFRFPCLLWPAYLPSVPRFSFSFLTYTSS
ncbi:hypothetical protein MLD38_040301 [Melastoma candidum]|uniref:Uncharacterized protein n=1 Tax=Melastoma candidum TaxID=119954 RepID=A0ACB9L6D8_9MYRT|nr:hypothetical protein MLD38_040301 [Melastoma candidum]